MKWFLIAMLILAAYAGLPRPKRRTWHRAEKELGSSVKRRR